MANETETEIDFDTFIKQNRNKPVPYYVLGVLVEYLHELKRDSNSRIRALEQRLIEIETKSMAYEGVWQEGKTYAAGAAVTKAGSIWHTKRATCGTPGGPLEMDRAWTLAVKHGRDGKDAR